MEFRVAQLDNIGKGLTAFVIILFAALSALFLIKIPAPYSLIFVSICALIAVISYLWSPKRYRFEGSKLIIEKVAGRRIVIALEGIEAYVTIPDLSKLKVSRTLGNGGLFGYYGIFSTAEYGEINCQLTSLKNLIIIKTKKGTFGLSPADLGGFEQHLRSTVTGIAGRLETLAPAPAGSVKRASPVILLVPTVVFIATFALAMNLAPRMPERIAVHFDIYGNPDRWTTAAHYLTSSLFPAVFLFAINVIIFFTVRQTTARPLIPNFLVLFLSLIQCLVGYVAVDLYWFNARGTHPIPMGSLLIGFSVIVLLFLLGYYRMLRRRP